MYKIQLQVEAVKDCPTCSRYYLDKRWGTMQSQDKEYTYNTPIEAYRAFGMAYGVLDWQSTKEKEVEVDTVYGGIDTYGRTINFRIIKA
jgi:hypothetical protein